MQLLKTRLGRFWTSMTPGRVFMLLLILFEVGTLFLLVVTRGNALGDLLFHDRHDTLMDFFHPILGYETISPDNLYTDATVFYPPLAMLLFYGLYRLIPEELEFASPYEARTEQFTLVMALICVVMLSVLMVLILMELRKGTATEQRIFALCALLSYPMLYQLDRGNLILLAFLFTLLFVLWMDSESRVLRELALISLALAFGLKGYPALFGVLLLIKRRWKESIRCAIYGLAAFLIPALFFEGIDLFGILRDFGSMSDSVVTEGFGYKVNFSNTIRFLMTCMGIETGGQALSSGLCFALGILCLLAALVPGTLWKKLCLVAIVIAGVPGVSYAYVMMFFLIPAAVFLKETKGAEQRKGWDYVYAVLLVACLAPLPFSGWRYVDKLGYPMTCTVLAEGLAIILLAVLLIADGAITGWRLLKQRGDGQVSSTSQIQCPNND